MTDFAHVMGQVRNIKLLQAIAKRLKKLRVEKGISQEELYLETNIHIGRIESAKANITISTIDVLCKYFDISIEEFFKGI